MKISELGEFELVELIAKTLNQSRDAKAASWQNLIVGAGDDAAAWYAAGKVQLATVDALVENVHFSLDYTGWQDLGWKALAVNLSDIAAMGGVPTYALVSLALPPEIEVDSVLDLYRGILELAGKHGVAIVGGDTDSTPQISITVTALGIADNKDGLLLRSAARPGELIAVTGNTGNAAAGYQMLSKKLKIDGASVELAQAFLRPVPRITEGQLLLKNGIRTAIDISDGLLSDLRHICLASQVGAHIDASKLPVAPEVSEIFGKKALEMALSGGEDYELLFTGRPEAIEKVGKQAGCRITVIGEITAAGPGDVTVFGRDGRLLDMKRQGWQHFKDRE